MTTPSVAATLLLISDAALNDMQREADRAEGDARAAWNAADTALRRATEALQAAEAHARRTRDTVKTLYDLREQARCDAAAIARCSNVPDGMLEISGSERYVMDVRPYYDRRVTVEVGHHGRRYHYEVAASDLTAASPGSGPWNVDEPQWDPIGGEGATHGRYEDGLFYTGPGVGPASAHQAAVEAYRLVGRWLHAAGVDTNAIQRPWPGAEPPTTPKRRRR